MNQNKNTAQIQIAVKKLRFILFTLKELHLNRHNRLPLQRYHQPSPTPQPVSKSAAPSREYCGVFCGETCAL